MFTGLVEDLGTVKAIHYGALNTRLTVETKLNGISIGDSVAVNGACLTVVAIKQNLLTFDISKETLSRTNLKYLKTGDKVNLERALTLTKPLGGHIVQGHIDTVGKIEELKPLGEHYSLKVSFESKFSPYVVEKGSIAIDGISLTINSLGPNWVKINLIPHTFRSTVFRFRKRGDFVNIEFDLFGKYVIRYLKTVVDKNRLLKEFFS